jgi:natural product precursor
MKKLSKIRLLEATVMSDNEMKMVVGGSGGIGSDEKCKWFSCTCSAPTSGVIKDTIYRTVKGTDIREVTNALANGDCKLYNSVSCSFDKDC